MVKCMYGVTEYTIGNLVNSSPLPADGRIDLMPPYKTVYANVTGAHVTLR